MEKFITFREFETRADAAETAALLEENSIPSEIELNPGLLDQNIIGRQYNNKVLLKIRGADFKKAHEVLIDNTRVDLSGVEKGYMLLSLSNEELLDVIAKPDEWGEYNYNVALALLKQRGISMDDRKKEALQEQHISDLRIQRTITPGWMFLGYGSSLLGIAACLMNSAITLLILYGFYLLPGLLGLIMGMVIRYTKKTLPDGEQILSYNAGARRHGLLMLLLGLVSLAVIILRGITLHDQSF